MQDQPAKTPNLSDFRRIVVKVGSSLLVDAAAGKLKEAWLLSLADDIAKLHSEGRDIIVVSSGSIALGRSVLKLPKGPLKLEDSQAAAAVGQIALARTWSEVLGQHNITAGQILVTLTDTEERRRYLNARSTIGKLWSGSSGDTATNVAPTACRAGRICCSARNSMLQNGHQAPR